MKEPLAAWARKEVGDSVERRCFTCDTPVINCTSFALARDIVALMDGKPVERVREFCGVCDLTGKMQRWVAANPVDAAIDSALQATAGSGHPHD